MLETAEGNPLFLEQLLALLTEGGLAERRDPADDPGAARRAPRPARPGRARSDRAWRRWSARSSRRGVVDSCSGGRAAPVPASETSPAEASCGHTGAVELAIPSRPHSGGGYRAAPKACARSFTSATPTGSNADRDGIRDHREFVGYHLEQAYRLRTELGERIGGLSAWRRTRDCDWEKPASAR